MKKDIYIIKNDINDKVYIGQTVDVHQRWAQYQSLVKKTPDKQVISRAMKRYGIEHFSIEIIESQVENYDEREKYWIEYYNSIVPNGYNVAPGGKGVGNGINAPGAKIKDDELLKSLIDEIIQNEFSLKELAKKYNISYGIINEINQGRAYRQEKLYYPLRATKKYDEEFLKQLTYSLKYELDKTLKDLSKEYQIDYSFLVEINLGKAYFRDYLTYPIRLGKMKKSEVLGAEIQELLQKSELSQKEIAKKYNVSCQWVSNINLGKVCKKEDLSYPLRKTYQNKKINKSFSPKEILEIQNLLKKSTLSLKQIAQKFETTDTVIANINNGRTKKYRNLSDKDYPIRRK